MTKQCFFILLVFNFINNGSVLADQNDLLSLNVEELLNIKVTSVAKKTQSLNDSAAAIYVITHEAIKRVGATSIPEALRLAPGVDVARIDGNKWAVTVRGFNGHLANKLLVLIDGRNVYSRLFAGVYWDNQDVMLEDIDRIEVIRGPGAALWGANAVNGVINIISKHSADTQGGLIVAGGGTEEQAFGAFRYGTQLNQETTARVYLKGFKRDSNTFQSGDLANDDWEKGLAGFRMDSQLTLRDNLTIQGDAFYSSLHQNTSFPSVQFPFITTFNETITSFGGNLLARYQHRFSSTSNYSLQIFYDFNEREESFFRDSRQTIDLDFQYRFDFLGWNDLVWGAGYRYTRDDISTLDSIAEINPSSRNDQLFSAFVQDEITLVDNSLWLTLGSKFEHNDYSGFEVQPTARLMWMPHHQHRIWAAVSRAVRTPSRGEHDLDIFVRTLPPEPVPGLPFNTPPVAFSINGNKGFDSEDVLSYELGYRSTFIQNLSVDFTVFFNHYSKLRSVQFFLPRFNADFIEQDVFFENKFSADTYGFEVSTVWQMLHWWRWDAHYSFLKTDLQGLGAGFEIAKSPQQRVSVRSALSLTESSDLDVLFRYVDKNRPVRAESPIINDYFSLDIRLAWRPVKALELSLVGQNLLASHHLEYAQEAFSQLTKIDRGVYAKFSWQF